MGNRHNKRINYKSTDPQKSRIKYPDSGQTEPEIDYPIFCFKHIHKDFSIEHCEAKEQKNFSKRLITLGKLEYKFIDKQNRHGYGWEKIKIAQLNFSPPPFITEDVAFVYAYRFSDKLAFVAHRRSGSPILHILGIDVSINKSCYPHGN